MAIGERSLKPHLRRPQDENVVGGEDDIDFWSVYTTEIQLGNPPLNFDAIIDTSWSPFFIPSASCTFNKHERGSCIIHPLYNSSMSSTYRADLSPCKMTYWGVEGVRTYGVVSNDSLYLSDLEIQNQTFEEVLRWQPGGLTDDDFFDTVLGLALNPSYDIWGNFTAPGPFQNMVAQGLIPESIFSLTLPRTDDTLGQLVLGTLPANVVRDELVEVPLNDTRLGEGSELWDFYTSNGWQISVESIEMSQAASDTGEMVTLLDDQKIAVITSSYPYIGLPREATAKANQLLGLAGRATWVDCNTRSKLPDLVFTFRPGINITLIARDYLLEVYDDIFERRKCVTTFLNLGTTGDDGIILLGTPFLTGLHSVFDADRRSISFGNRGD
ncbi:aspartic peptidase domain-containing protein [Paraphoma chrysanthemicola]|uniref:Aspartic peptidase domain-containing protein n=1 Tax=Paraphoma chrysanthemicola TaxID=798071 RepID=A0A8K0R074_9PLEO|nr:aspartic peptidase domain-containing protein [Paraphoma chrysanthemicola]